MHLPLQPDIHTLLVLVIVSFMAVVIAEGVFIFIHHNKAAHAQGFAMLCFMWGVAELVQLFIPGLIVEEGVSNFNSSYMLLAAVVSSSSLYFALSAVAFDKFRMGSYVLYVIPLLLLIGSYIALWYFDLAQERTNYYFPAVWKNELTWDFWFCAAAFAYIVIDTIYVLLMLRSALRLYEAFGKEHKETANNPVRWVSQMIFWAYGLLALFAFFVAQSDIAITVIYKSFLMVIVPLMGLGYIINAISLEEGKVSFKDVYELRWRFLSFEWKLVPKQSYADKKERPEGGLAVYEDGRLTDESSAELRKKLEEWMRIEKPFVKADFRAVDVYKYLGIDRYTCNDMFAREFNCYFKAWVLNYRIDYSVELMKSNPTMQIKSIAYESGFSSQAVFARAFANVKGMSCSEFRRRLANGENFA